MNRTILNGNRTKFKTIAEMLLETCSRYSGSKTAIMFKKKDVYESMDYFRLRELVECFALGLMELGIHAGDRVGIVAENRIEWIIADLAICCIGAVDVPIFPTNSPKQEEYIFNDCEATAIIVSNNYQLSKVMQFKERVLSLRHIIVMNDEFETFDVFVKSFSGIMKRGAELKSADERRAIFEDACMKVNPDDLLTIIYTSGTTGNPKGVMLTHRNLVANIKSIHYAIYFDENDTFLSFLPLCHSYERTTAYYAGFSAGATLALAESTETVAANILEIKPTMMTTVPKLLDTIKKKIYFNIEKESGLKKRIFYWAVDVGKKYIRRKMANDNVMFLEPQRAIAEKLVYKKIRERTGGRLDLFVSGGGALPDEVCEFFLAVGLTVIEGYGLTEASPVVAVNRIDSIEIGTVGPPLPDVEIKFADDGEILVRGDNVMKGYWKNRQGVSFGAIDEDGWLRTGDCGYLTAKGNLKITDRKKNIFVSSGGKNIAPAQIENILSQSRYIEQVILIGDNREYCTALIVPSFEQLGNLAEKLGLRFENSEDLISDKEIIYHIHKDIDLLQKDLAKYERVRRFQLLPKPFSIDSGELSPKMSVKRHVVEQKFAELIEAMYGKK